MDRDPPSVLPSGAEFVGPVYLAGPARIDGSIDGEVIAAACVWFGASAFIKARVTAPEIIVDGTLEGSLDATSRIELRATARVRADVRAPRLLLEEGAILEGRCSAGTRSRGEMPDPSANSASCSL